MTLAHEFTGVGDNISFIHGFTQTSQSWKKFITHLRTPLCCQLIDAPGHGLSHNGARSLWQAGQDIINTMHHGVLVGYSMGARMALHAAFLNSGKITGLVLISGTPGIQDEDERMQRHLDDTALADRISAIGVNAFITEWLQKPMFAGVVTSEEELADRQRNTQQGLSDSLRYAGTATQSSLWERLNELSMPVLLIAGGDDKKFVHIATKMHHLMPMSTLCIIADAGHSVHLESPAEVARIIDQWLLDTEIYPHRKRDAKN
jgi:2-succinyl-6-hydroxy-2,4-cyclohexadiene-1-carboxylate synthase